MGHDAYLSPVSYLVGFWGKRLPNKANTGQDRGAVQTVEDGSLTVNSGSRGFFDLLVL